jgi:hypothetical protein
MVKEPYGLEGLLLGSSRAGFWKGAGGQGREREEEIKRVRTSF